jgi:predicted phosphoribosyltransferase
MLFIDRRDAGRALAESLQEYAGQSDVLVLALPRGGVPVAYEVARALRAPLDVFLVRKLGVPSQEELAMGAIASGGICLLNESVVRGLDIPPEQIEEAVVKEQQELKRREQLYRDDRPAPQLRGRTVILVDDGLATGASMRAAVAALRRQGTARIVVAVPVGPPDTCEKFRAVVDDVVCASTPEPFFSVGRWYENFAQTTDEEVHDLLERAAQEQAQPAPSASEG